MRHELPAMIEMAERMLKAGEGLGTLATLFSARGSTYRPLGSMMVGLPGMRAGGVSGGCLEEYVAYHGGLLTQHHPVAVLRFSTDPSGDLADDVPVLGCGGSIEVLVERLTPDHLALLKALAKAYDADERSLLACTVDVSGGAAVVSRRWLGETDGTPDETAELERVAAGACLARKSRHASLGPGRAALVYYIPPLTRLVIFGAGDDVRPVCDLGRSLGWHVTVADRRPRLATAARFPNADAVLAGNWERVMREIRFTQRTAALLMTHSVPDDARVLSLMAEKDLGYVGALGPAHRRQWLLEEVAAEGVPLGAPCTSRLRGPVGLDLGDRSAAGIAVAVVAEVLAWLNERDARPLCTPVRGPAVPKRRAVCHA